MHDKVKTGKSNKFLRNLLNRTPEVKNSTYPITTFGTEWLHILECDDDGVVHFK